MVLRFGCAGQHRKGLVTFAGWLSRLTAPPFRFGAFCSESGGTSAGQGVVRRKRCGANQWLRFGGRWVGDAQWVQPASQGIPRRGDAIILAAAQWYCVIIIGEG
jgi:hypothetical protein